MILVGTVIHTYEINYSNNYSFVHEVDVRVEQYLKGEGPAIVRISGFGQGADCLSVIQNDVHAVFFVNGNPDGILNANYTGVHDATWQPTPETISEIVSITNHTVDPYPLPLSAQIARWFSHPLTGMRLAVVVLVLVFVAGIFYMRYHDPRKPKQKAKRS